jgi:hypothetical protein
MLPWQGTEELRRTRELLRRRVADALAPLVEEREHLVAEQLVILRCVLAVADLATVRSMTSMSRRLMAGELGDDLLPCLV